MYNKFIIQTGSIMKNFFLIILLFNFSSLFAEEVPAGYVANWKTIPLSDSDYTVDPENLDLDCRSFVSILSKGKIEQPQVIPLKMVKSTLVNFIKGYKSREDIVFDTVVIWPNYEQSDWYVLMANNN